MSEILNPEQKPSKVAQESALADIQKKHMMKLLNEPGLLDRSLADIRRHSPKREMKGDVKAAVASLRAEHSKTDGTIEYIEDLLIGIEIPGRYGISIMYATVGTKAVGREGEDAITPRDGFTFEDAQLVSGCLDELELAQLSGEIPDLSHDRSKVQMPYPAK